MRLDKKNKLLLFGFFVTLYICYAFAFSKTMEYYRQYRSQKESLNSGANNTDLLRQLVQKEKQLDKVLDNYSAISGDSYQNQLLDNLSSLSQKYHLKIIDFKEPHLYLENELKVISYTFSLQGSFNGILLLINNIENNPSSGAIKHISFIKKKDYKTNTDYLTAEVILQKRESVKSSPE